uniref:Putative secreted protein n=1 Tax=Anopheles darlingi TaxID=43151 RepID=A0A2M4D0P9_ANODA
MHPLFTMHLRVSALFRCAMLSQLAAETHAVHKRCFCFVCCVRYNFGLYSCTRARPLAQPTRFLPIKPLFYGRLLGLKHDHFPQCVT